MSTPNTSTFFARWLLRPSKQYIRRADDEETSTILNRLWCWNLGVNHVGSGGGRADSAFRPARCEQLIYNILCVEEQTLLTMLHNFRSSPSPHHAINLPAKAWYVSEEMLYGEKIVKLSCCMRKASVQK